MLDVSTEKLVCPFCGAPAHDACHGEVSRCPYCGGTFSLKSELPARLVNALSAEVERREAQEAPPPAPQKQALSFGAVMRIFWLCVLAYTLLRACS